MSLLGTVNSMRVLMSSANSENGLKLGEVGAVKDCYTSILE